LDGGENLYLYAPEPTGWIDPVGLAKKRISPCVCEDVEKKGKATVYWHDNRGPGNVFGHYSVKTNASGKTLHTHQLGAPGTKTMISSNLSGVPSPKKSFTFDLPNAFKAQEFQRSVLDKLGDDYDTRTRSCVTHVGDVLRAGGVDIPKEPGAQFKFLRKKGL
jgi:hypothetical protein